eukprot:TRINITY_DN2453_c0_g1_i1.p2 TRINITY_DN2453_c0_g1~~TRINITY_DN2453_c0_g1_i1.p2  ORF type:complete len:444 (-),score=85.38 TRINITY_DN2453_c0_g1_i1:1784-3115(-)
MCAAALDIRPSNFGGRGQVHPSGSQSSFSTWNNSTTSMGTTGDDVLAIVQYMAADIPAPIPDITLDLDIVDRLKSAAARYSPPTSARAQHPAPAQAAPAPAKQTGRAKGITIKFPTLPKKDESPSPPQASQGTVSPIATTPTSGSTPTNAHASSANTNNSLTNSGRIKRKSSGDVPEENALRGQTKRQKLNDSPSSSSSTQPKHSPDGSMGNIPSPGTTSGANTSSSSSSSKPKVSLTKLTEEARKMKHKAEEMMKSKDPEIRLIGITIYLQSILKFFECGQLYEDRSNQQAPQSEDQQSAMGSSLSMFRSTVGMLKYFISNCDKADETFLSALGERCLAFCHAKCFRLNASNLRQMHRQLTNQRKSSSTSSSSSGKDRTDKFLTEVNDALCLYESLAKIERVSPDTMDPIPQEILCISTASFIDYVKSQMQKHLPGTEEHSS